MTKQRTPWFATQTLATKATKVIIAAIAAMCTFGTEPTLASPTQTTEASLLETESAAPTPRKDKKSSATKSEQTVESQKRVEIFFIGNSITYGARLQDKVHQAPPAAAVAKVSEDLSQRMPDATFRCHNMGVSGKTTTDWLPTGKKFFANLVDSANKVAADAHALIFSISLGTNDSAEEGPHNCALSAEAYKQNLRAIVDSLIKSYPKSHVVVHAPIWYSDNTYNTSRYLKAGQQRLKTYIGAVRKLVASYNPERGEHIHLGDTQGWDIFEGRTELFAAETGKAGIFSLHPNEAGAKKLGELWASGIERAIRAATAKRVVLPSGAEMFVYPTAKESAKRAVVILPGGGYVHLAKTHEGSQVAEWMSEGGVTAFVLHYQMPKGNSDVPNTDAREAIEYARAHATELGGYTEVGIMGSSAGGHLASTVATHTDLVDFQILLYPVISMNPAHTHRGSHDNLLGKEASKEREDLFSNEKQVSAKTPRAFVALSLDDKVVPPLTNGLPYVEALTKAGVKATLVCYPTGGHGWGFRDGFTYSKEWKKELAKFLFE